MKEFFDTSVLVAAFLADHPHHLASAKALAAATRSRSCCAAHSLAEFYSVATRLPVRPLIAPEQAMLFIQDVRDRLAIVALDPAQYYAAIERAAAQGVAGGRIYDALLVETALKVRAETIYTWNLGQFRGLAPQAAGRIRNP